MNRTPVVLAMLLAALMPWGGAAFALPIIHVEAPEMLSRDAMFVGGATILSLVAFGSLFGSLSGVLSHRATQSTYGKNVPKKFLLGMSSAALGSAFLMLTAASPADVWLSLLLSLSLIFLGMLVVMFTAARLLDAMFKKQQDDPTSSPSTGSPFP